MQKQKNIFQQIIRVLLTGLVAVVWAWYHSEAPASLSGDDGTISVSPGTPVDFCQVVNTWPHDRGAFTEGLVYLDGVLLESTGLNGRSSLRRVELNTGRVLQQVDRPFRIFRRGSHRAARQIVSVVVEEPQRVCL